MELKTTLTFVRAVHRISQRQKLSWALIPVLGTANYDLGVYLVGTDKILNIKTGHFEQLDGESYALTATRKADGDWYVYTAKDASLRLPKYYVSDMYYTRVYNKEMMDSYLL